MRMGQIEIAIQEKIKEISFHGKLGGKRIFLFGHNGYTGLINNLLYDEGYRLCSIIDNDKEKQGKCIIDIPIAAPESVDWGADAVCLTAAAHVEGMVEQLHQFSDEVELIRLADTIQYRKDVEQEEKFWLEEKYEQQMRKICEGASVYNRIKKEEHIIVFCSALGDIFAGGMYFQEYEKKIQTNDIKIVIASEGVYRTAHLFNIKNIEVITEKEMDALIKFIFFYGVGNKDIVVCSCIHTLDAMARYKKISFPKFWAKYFFRLEDSYEVHFPSIWDRELRETELVNKGLIKGKSIILAPYANSVENLPFQFWEELVEIFRKMNYQIFTNIVGKQRAVKGTIGIKIPLHRIGNYLEYAGHFISLRSGLCDVAGHANCRKIIIFRDRKIEWSRQIDFFDIHTENISSNAVQYVYDDNDFYKNIDMVLRYMADG